MYFKKKQIYLEEMNNIDMQVFWICSIMLLENILVNF